MASRNQAIHAYLPRNTSWHKVDMNELVNLIASRTGFDKGEIRQVLQELDDTAVYVPSRGSRNASARN